MLTEISLGFISFINYFFVPVISLRIYSTRHTTKWEFSPEILYQYILMCVLNMPVGRVVATLAEKVMSTTILADSTKYTLLALVVAVVLPYIIEVLEKLIRVEVEIELNGTKEKNEKAKEE